MDRVEIAISATAELVATAFELVLWPVADHGRRPGKVVGPILTVIVFFLLLFWLLLRIVAFEPKGEDQPGDGGERRLRPIGPLFFFDRMIPLYKISNDNCAVARYFRRATAAEIAGGADGAPDPALRSMTYLGRKFFVYPVDDARRQSVDKWLNLLRLLGAGLTIFLLAAISALTR